MSAIDVVILGMVKKKPQGAYELQKGIEYRNLSKWVKISNPNIYKKVKQLEKKNFIKGHDEKDGNMPSKTIYSITEEGDVFLEQEIIKISQEQVSIYLDLNAVIVNLDLMPDESKEQCVENIYNQIKTMRESISMSFQERSHIPESGKTVMKQQLKLAEALEDWAKELKRKVD